MRVLIVEEQLGSGTQAESALHAAGHVTTSCSDPTAAAPCNGLVHKSQCPLDESAIDVAVLALNPESGEAVRVPAGYVCARRASIPLVVLGPTDRLGFASEDSGLAPTADELVDVVEQTARRPLRAHSEASNAAAREVLDQHDLETVDVSSWVERSAGRLHARIVTSEPVDAAVTQMLAVRALSAIREVDPTASAIGISVET